MWGKVHNSLALAFQTCKPGQSHYEAGTTAWLGLAYMGLDLPSSWPQARPCTALLTATSLASCASTLFSLFSHITFLFVGVCMLPIMLGVHCLRARWPRANPFFLVLDPGPEPTLTLLQNFKPTISTTTNITGTVGHDLPVM